jgi:hypothetical protein
MLQTINSLIANIHIYCSFPIQISEYDTGLIGASTIVMRQTLLEMVIVVETLEAPVLRPMSVWTHEPLFWRNKFTDDI